MAVEVRTDYPAAETLKVFCRALMVAFTLTGYGCNADRVPPTPVAPSPTVPERNPAPNPTVQDRIPAGELWRLTTKIVSLEGSACFWTLPVGAKFEDWNLSVERSGPQVRFVYDVNNPHDNMSFVGAVNQASFTAASDTYRSVWFCSGDVTLSSSVIGTFSSDGRTLSGRERLVYRADRGGELIITFEWNATRTSESPTVY